ncbi:MAG: DUF4239 domain-containing protein [Candidatus Competibacter denitrificans]|jgi:hypothetical protein
MSLSAQLLLLPQWVTVLLMVGIAVAFSIIGFLVVHRYIPIKIRKIHNDVAGFVFATLGATYGVLLAFVVIVVWEQFNDTKITVENESSTALMIYHNLKAYPNKSAADTILQCLIEYARLSSTEAELRVGQSTEDSELALNRLFETLHSIIPENQYEQMIYGHVAQGLNDLLKLRGLRLQAANEELPSVIWIGMVVGGIITIGFTFLFGTENVWAHITMMSLLAALIAIVFYVVIQLDHPTMGAVHVGSPEAYSQILKMAEIKPSIAFPP